MLSGLCRGRNYLSCSAAKEIPREIINRITCIRYVKIIKANEKLFQMKHNPFDFNMLIDLEGTLNFDISGDIWGKFEEAN